MAVKGLLAGAFLLATAGCGGLEPFALRQNDRVLLLGNAFFERDRQYGHIETGLATRFPDKDVTFRNLGWTGDTVFGHSRSPRRRGAVFGEPEEGFQRLVEHVSRLDPTVIFVAYGLNESFSGDEGLTEFVEGFERLLDELESTDARVVLVSPIKMGCFMPSENSFVEKRNLEIDLYSDAIQSIAEDWACYFVDLRELLADCGNAPSGSTLSENGIHLTERGYRLASVMILEHLGIPDPSTEIQIDAANPGVADKNNTLIGVEVVENGLRFDVLSPCLPPAATDAMQSEVRRIRASGLRSGNYSLRIDGQIVAEGTSTEWAAGISVAAGPEIEQALELRRTIVRKNDLFLRSWRPRNDAFIYGERRHEQVPVQKELPSYDPLIRAHEARIARLRVPARQKYELIRRDSP